MNNARKFLNDMASYLSLPAVYVELRQLMGKPDATIDDYVAVIEKDSMLSTRIILISNSQFFGFSRKTQNLHQAISLIGVIQLHDILLNCLCIRAFFAVPKQLINMKSFWEYSIHCGIASRVIAQHSLIESSHQFFTFGILHEIGHAAMYVKVPEMSLQVLEAYREQNGSITELEREVIGLDYSQLGAEIMELWHLPPIYNQVAAHHLQPQHASEEYREVLEIVHLAHIICQTPVAGQHQQLISSSIANHGHFAALPTNIDEIILNNISTHGDSVLQILFPDNLRNFGFGNDQVVYG